MCEQLPPKNLPFPANNEKKSVGSIQCRIYNASESNIADKTAIAEENEQHKEKAFLIVFLFDTPHVIQTIRNKVKENLLQRHQSSREH